MTTTAVMTAGLVARLLAEGWREGPPEHVTARTVAIDAAVCRRLRCPKCRRRGLAARPMRNGRRYTTVAECECGHAEVR